MPSDPPATSTVATTASTGGTPGASSGELVLITGGTGLIALHCIHKALLAGYAVRTTVRSLSKSDVVTEALSAALANPGLTDTALKGKLGLQSDGEILSRLSFAEANLLSDDGWDQAVAGAKYILHVASPFPAAAPKDVERELIRPAVDGTLRVLKAAVKARKQASESQTAPVRVVVTSSIAAVAFGIPNPDGRVFTEKDWSDAEKIKGYTKSKVLAEKAAWDYMKTDGDAAGLELSVVNPAAVFGPPLRPKDRASTTVGIIRQMLAGEMPLTPRIGLTSVDVRDVADLHLLAMTRSEAKGQRYIALSGDAGFLGDVAAMLRAAGQPDGELGREFGPDATKKVSSRNLPDWVFRIAASVVSQLKDFKEEVGMKRHMSSEKAQKELGWSPRSPEEAVVSCARELLRANAV